MLRDGGLEVPIRSSEPLEARAVLNSALSGLVVIEEAKIIPEIGETAVSHEIASLSLSAAEVQVDPVEELPAAKKHFYPQRLLETMGMVDPRMMRRRGTGRSRRLREEMQRKAREQFEAYMKPSGDDEEND